MSYHVYFFILIFLFFSTLLLPDGTLVESQLLTLQNIPINTTTLTRSGSNHGVQTTRLKLTLNGRLNLAMVGIPSSLLLLNALALLLLTVLGGLVLLASAANSLPVVGLVPLPERRSVDLDNGRLGQSVGTDQFVAGRVVGHNNHTCLARNTFGSPREIARVETQATEFAVTATGADEVNPLGTDTGLRGLTTLVKSSISFFKSVRC